MRPEEEIDARLKDFASTGDFEAAWKRALHEPETEGASSTRLLPILAAAAVLVWLAATLWTPPTPATSGETGTASSVSSTVGADSDMEGAPRVDLGVGEIRITKGDVVSSYEVKPPSALRVTRLPNGQLLVVGRKEGLAKLVLGSGAERRVFGLDVGGVRDRQHERLSSPSYRGVRINVGTVYSVAMMDTAATVYVSVPGVVEVSLKDGTPEFVGRTEGHTELYALNEDGSHGFLWKISVEP